MMKAWRKRAIILGNVVGSFGSCLAIATIEWSDPIDCTTLLYL